MVHITERLGKFVDRFILAGEVLVVVVVLLYFLTDWLDVYASQVLLLLFLMLGLVGVLSGARTKRLPFRLMSFLGGAGCIIATLSIPFAYSTWVLTFSVLLVLIPLIFARKNTTKSN